MSGFEIKTLLSKLNIGTFENQLTVLSRLLKLANNVNDFDVDRLITYLFNVNHPEITFKVLILLSHLAVNNKANKKQICRTPEFFHLAKKLLDSNSVKKIIGILYLMTSILHLTETDSDASFSNNSSFIIDTKNKIKEIGILNQMCMLFLESNSKSTIWEPLCKCLAECCNGDKNNQNALSHIIPKCVKELNCGYQLELVNLVIAITHTNYVNQEKFVTFGGLQSIVRGFLNSQKGLELMCVILTNCPPAIEEAHMSDVVQLLDSIFKESHSTTPTINQLMISKWCSLALWILENIGDIRETQKPKNKTDIKKSTKNSSKNSTINSVNKFKKKHMSPNLKIKKILNKSMKSNVGNLVVSKFDAISKRYIPNKNNQYLNSTSQHNKMFQNNFVFDKNNCMDSFNHIEFNKERNSFSESNKENIFLYDEEQSFGDIINNVSITGCDPNDDSFSEFNPRFTSSPLEDKFKQRKIDFFKPSEHNAFKKLFVQPNTKINSFETDKASTSKMDVETSIPSSFRVRQLVKEVIDKQNNMPNNSVNNKDNLVYFLKPEGWTQIHNKTNNSVLGYNISIIHNLNATTNERNINTTGKLDKMEITNLSNVSICSDVCEKKICDTCNHLTVSKQSSSNENDMNNTVKRLKIGVSLYGCDFQKISETMWSENEQITAKYLYEVFQDKIVKK